MKHLKILALAAMACAALMAFASTASATALYSGTTKLGATAEIKSSLAVGTSAELITTSGELFMTCTTSRLSDKIINAGSATETASGPIEAFVIENCTKPVTVREKGELEIHWISGTINGTVTSRKTVVSYVTTLFGGEVECTYTTGAGADLGTLTGSTSGNATMDINAIITKTEPSSFLCPSTMVWKATYTVTSPSPLHATKE